MKFEFDWPSGLIENVDRQTDGWTDEGPGVTGILLAHP